jgi:lipopolysaccharide biosynthesis glycosyltransferase
MTLIYIAQDKLSRQPIELIKSIRINAPEFSTRIHGISHSDIDIWPPSCSFVQSNAQYWRWDIPLYCKENAVYFDTDCILEADANELNDIDIGDNLIGAVRDKWAKDVRGTAFHQSDANIQVLDLSLPSYYSGQLIINCELWRKENIRAQLIAFAKQYHASDMIALNYVCRGRIYELPAEWCVSANYEDRVGKLYHWHGKKKPWNEVCRNQNIFDKYK